MPSSHPPYPLEFRNQILELIRAGRTPDDLTKKVEPTTETIHNWDTQADRDAGNGHDGFTIAEREE